jgi:acetyl-CoA acyltransferase
MSTPLARAAATAAAGGFASEILPVSVTGPDGDQRTLTADETIRVATTAGGLAALKPSFRDEELGRRFPEIDWKITPGNSSPLTDAASAVLIMSEEKANSLGLRPRARFHSFAVTGSDPLLMLTGVIPATQKLLTRAGLSLDDIDACEVNEAFAPVPLVWQREMGADPERLNPRGGAIALGHPLGASGTRLLTTLVNHLEATGGRYGLQTMCEGGGMANATLIERL